MPNMPPPKSPIGMPLRVGPVSGVPGDGHAATHGLHHLIEGRPMDVRTSLAKPCNRAGNDSRIDAGQHRMVNPESLGHTDAEVIEHHIRQTHQIQEYLPAL